jgi:DNA-binding transcriptional LysR family regulator
VEWKWTEAHHKAFNKAKKIVACDVMLAYPNFNKEFVIHMDASHRVALLLVVNQNAGHHSCYNNVLNGEIDIAVVGGEIPDEFRKTLTIEHFVEDELSLIISKSHPFMKQKKIPKEDLYYLNFITLNSNSTI